MIRLGLTLLSSVCAMPVSFALGSSRKPRVTLRPLNDPITLPADQMVRLVKRECARIDRNGLTCSLAVFPLPANAAETGPAVLNILRERARLTDVAGWLDDKTICVFLTDASLQGAQHFADSARISLLAANLKLAPAVYTYDGKWTAVGAPTGTPCEPVPALAMSA